MSGCVLKGSSGGSGQHHALLRTASGTFGIEMSRVPLNCVCDDVVWHERSYIKTAVTCRDEAMGQCVKILNETVLPLTSLYVSTIIHRQFVVNYSLPQSHTTLNWSY